MKVFTVLCFFTLLICLLPAASPAQITFTASGLLSKLQNTEFNDYHYNDTMTINLGVASNSQQDFNFQNLPISKGQSGDTSFLAFASPAGHLRANEFPDATLCINIAFSRVYGPYTYNFTYAMYMNISNNGWYNLGGAAQSQWTPSLPPGQHDTTVVVHYVAMQNPLPATLGLNQSWKDTTYDPTNTRYASMRTIESRTISFDGFGNVTYPDGRTLSSLRILSDQVVTVDTNGVFYSRSHSKQVKFVAEDYTQLGFSVDSSYAGGTALTKGHEFMVKSGAAGVRQLSRTAPAQFNLAQNYPNPFNPTTKISFAVSQTEFVSLEVYNMLGQEVATLVNGHMMPGSYEVSFDASTLSSGLYFYRLSAGSFSRVRKMSLVK